MPYTKQVLGVKPLYVRGPLGNEVEYTARQVRLLSEMLFSEGVVGDNDYLVSVSAGLTLSVAAGIAFVAGSMVADQGMYMQENDAAVLIAVGAHHATLPRIDRVILRVLDAQHDTSGLYEGRIEIVPGTATAGATLVNLDGANDLTVLDEDSLNLHLLANALIPATAGAVTLGDVRAQATIGSGTAASSGGGGGSLLTSLFF